LACDLKQNIMLVLVIIGGMIGGVVLGSILFRLIEKLND
jgi:hypothetical protein